MSETIISYYESRLSELGITEKDTTVDLWQNENGKNVLKPFKIFEQIEDGIFIRVFGLDRLPINYAKGGSRWKNKSYGIIRLENPIVKPNGETLKYLLPKGQKTLPFIHPDLIDKYEKREKIKVLYITEGYFKAFKAQMHGIDCIGLASITCMKDKETGRLHSDIVEIMIKCNVESIVWLVDGDCRNITTKEITEERDLYTRPYNFFRTAQAFSDLLSPYEGFNKYFAHVNSDNIEGNPKGIDDLLCQYGSEAEKIKQELHTFDKETGVYVVKYNISFGLAKIRRYFMLNDVDQFYLFHLERRQELKNKEFKFNGTLYQYDEEQGKCQIKIPSSAANYFRVGDEYYEYVQIPNKFGQLQNQYHRRKKETIALDNGKSIFNHIPKYKAFCTVPDHTNYQRIINNCFNLYFPFEYHELEEGDFDNTINFLKHIFGTRKIKVNETTECENWELGLDYIQLLYQRPQQILPILSLVSNERQTGKTTFINWLAQIFTENMAIVGNEDLASQFNSHWTSKLIVACDETKIDKQVVMEKIKNLSTSHKIMMNAKGRDQLSCEFFAKFILCSNNEDNFATIDKEEIRFWVLKVPRYSGSNNVDLLTELHEEIPAFLHYLNSRKMITENLERHWFETRLLRTEALEKVVNNSRPNAEKIIIHGITELFENSELDTITLPLNAIAAEILKKPNDKDYVKRLLHNMGYKTHAPARRTYPRIYEKPTGDNQLIITTIPVQFHGRYYEFKREDFIKIETTTDLGL